MINTFPVATAGSPTYQTVPGLGQQRPVTVNVATLPGRVSVDHSYQELHRKDSLPLGDSSVPVQYSMLQRDDSERGATATGNASGRASTRSAHTSTAGHDDQYDHPAPKGHLSRQQSAQASTKSMQHGNVSMESYEHMDSPHARRANSRSALLTNAAAVPEADAQYNVLSHASQARPAQDGSQYAMLKRTGSTQEAYDVLRKGT
eukprot:scpid84249/ scgid3263/ 